MDERRAQGRPFIYTFIIVFTGTNLTLYKISAKIPEWHLYLTLHVLFPRQDAPGSFEVLESFVLSKLRQAAELQKRTQQEQEDDKDDKEGGSATPSTFSCFPSAARVAVPPVEPPSSKQVLGCTRSAVCHQQHSIF